MDEIRLSICIATLNRAYIIEETLLSILNQIETGVEIVVFDGGSTDGTVQLLSGYQQKYPCLRYVRQERPGGIDQDYAETVKYCSGTYCWLLTDDDVLKRGAIKRVIEATSEQYGLIIVNAEEKSADLSELIDERKLNISEDKIYTPLMKDKFFSETMNYLSFIGCVIIRKDIWDSRNKEDYFGTLFIHVGVIFQEIIEQDILVISEPMMSIRAGNAQWTNRWFEIWNFLWPNLVWSFKSYSDTAKRSVCARQPWKKISNILVNRALGTFSLEQYSKYIVPDSKMWYKVVAYAVAVLPGMLVNCLLLFYLQVTMRQRSGLFYYLKNSKKCCSVFKG